MVLVFGAQVVQNLLRIESHGRGAAAGHINGVEFNGAKKKTY